MISFSFSVVLSGSNGYHAWDIKENEMTKSSIVVSTLISIYAYHLANIQIRVLWLSGSP